MEKKVEKVSVKVKAIAEGYYQNRIIRVGEEFTYNGGLNAKGTLPLWVESLEKEVKKKADKKEAKVELMDPSALQSVV